MDAIKINANPRTPGKSGARAARRAKEVPAILYGHDFEPVSFQVAELDMRPLIYTAETHRVELSVGGETYDCILKDYDLHPVTDRPFHADFLLLRAGETLTMTVPVRYHGTPVGVKDGGDFDIYRNELTVVVLPKDIPSQIDVDVSELAIGDSIHIEDITLPEGVTFDGTENITLAIVSAPRKVELDEEGDFEGEIDAAGTDPGDATADDADDVPATEQG
jgi:large subunit ribosomal protein L25